MSDLYEVAESLASVAEKDGGEGRQTISDELNSYTMQDRVKIAHAMEKMNHIHRREDESLPELKIETHEASDETGGGEQLDNIVTVKHEKMAGLIDTTKVQDVYDDPANAFKLGGITGPNIIADSINSLHSNFQHVNPKASKLDPTP